MTEPLLLVDRREGVATVTFNDPARLNAMTEAMGEAISAAMADLANDDMLRAVILTGAGRAFSAGGDLDMIDRMGAAGRADPGGPPRAENRDFMRRFYGLYLSVRDLPQPTIAAVNGHAIGAGCCVALACDIRVAADEAKLGLNFARLGIHPGMAATWTLPRLVGPAHAAELLFTGRLLDGPEAARIGMVNRSLPQQDVAEQARTLADTIAQASPLAIRGTKRSLARTFTASLDEQLATEAHEQSLCYEDANLAEGLAAAREKRPPRFSDS
ncbi:MAG: enoyl-CoA hydratase/isomerase family protein [bacterium]|nr:enoyl-CoA hydratase/isomerase family protein [bacterium]